MTKTEITSRQNSAIEKTFKPTPNMIAWLDAAIENAAVNPSLISRQTEQDRNNWARWLKIEGFEDWFFAEYTKARRRWLPVLDTVGMKYAKQGSAEHFKIMRQVVEGRAPHEGVAVQVNNIIGTKRDEYEL